MKGLEIARKYYETYGAEMIEKNCHDISSQIAVGLVGEGSQCFGFDDDISKDHDFAPGFCMWLKEHDFICSGEKLQKAYDCLPDMFCGLSRDNIQDSSRVGVMSVKGFYRKYLGITDAPKTNRGWLFLRETALAVCTNGEVFRDELGKFSEIRKALLGFYPEDVLRKKIAARAAVMSQAGQYNLIRCLQREDNVASMLSVSRFTESALSMIFLLNRRYMPFYKWAYRSACDLPNLKAAVAKIGELNDMMCSLHIFGYRKARDVVFQITEDICSEVADELNRQGFSDVTSPFLQDHLKDIMIRIGDSEIRGLPAIYDYGI